MQVGAAAQELGHGAGVDAVIHAAIVNEAVQTREVKRQRACRRIISDGGRGTGVLENLEAEGFVPDGEGSVYLHFAAAHGSEVEGAAEGVVGGGERFGTPQSGEAGEGTLHQFAAVGERPFARQGVAVCPAEVPVGLRWQFIRHYAEGYSLSVVAVNGGGEKAEPFFCGKLDVMEIGR